MAILNSPIEQFWDSTTQPQVIYILTNDTKATVMGTGYLNAYAAASQFNFNNNMMALVYTTDGGSGGAAGSGWYQVSITGQNAAQNISLIGQQSGVVNSVTGTPNRITASAGPNVVIDIAATYVGQASITTLGLITTVTGIQNSVGAVGAPTYSFTGDTTTGLWHSGASNIDFSIAGVETANLSANTLSIYGHGGTGATLNLGLISGGSVIGFTVPAGLAASIDYVLPVTNPSAGQVLSASAPVANVSTLSWANGQKAAWVVAAANVNPLVMNTYYIASGAADIVFTMPNNPVVGDMVWVVGSNGATGWQIQLTGGQVAYQLDGAAGPPRHLTTAGGTITWDAAHTDYYSGCLLLCVVAGANGSFVQIGGSGNPIYA